MLIFRSFCSKFPPTRTLDFRNSCLVTYPDIHAVQEHGPLLRIVEPLQQAHHRRLAGARRSNLIQRRIHRQTDQRRDRRKNVRAYSIDPSTDRRVGGPANRQTHQKTEYRSTKKYSSACMRTRSTGGTGVQDNMGTGEREYCEYSSSVLLRVYREYRRSGVKT